MKSINETARAMTDDALADTEKRLRREVPAAQALLSAVKRERIRRRRAEKRAEGRAA